MWRTAEDEEEDEDDKAADVPSDVTLLLRLSRRVRRDIIIRKSIRTLD